MFILKWTLLLAAQLLEKIFIGNEGNCVCQVLICIPAFIIDTIEKHAEYINDDAFSFIAVTGDNFIQGAWLNYSLTEIKLKKFYAAAVFTNIFLFLSKIACVSANMMIYSGCLHANMVDKTKVTSMVYPSVIVGVLTWIIVSIFLSMFDISQDTMMISYAIDDYCHDKPQRGPQWFIDTLEKMRKASSQIED
jgi:hypothetical protein